MSADLISRKALINILEDVEQDGLLKVCQIIELLEDQPKAYEDTGWIPVEEQLPEAGEKVLVWYEYFRYGEYNRMYETYGIGWQYFGHWSGDVSGTKAKCIAWSPLPEPYRPERSSDEKE